MSTALDIEVEDQLDEETLSSENEDEQFEVPEGFEHAFDMAGLLLGLSEEVPRYDATIDPRWRQPELSIAWQVGDVDHIAAEIIIQGDRIAGRSRLIGVRFQGSKRRQRVLLHHGAEENFIVIVGGVEIRLCTQNEETWTIATSDLFDDDSLSTMTIPPDEIIWSKPKRTRGNVRGFSPDSHERYCDRLDERLPDPRYLAGRLIWASLSPDMRRPASHIRWQKEQLEAATKRISKENGVWILLRVGFAPQSENWRPHFHPFIVMPLNYSVEKCLLLSAKLKREFDKEWRRINGFGIMQDGWKLKKDAEGVEQAIEYAKQYETHDKAYGEWGRPWHEYGERPAVATHRITVTAPQMQRVWAALSTLKGSKAHPWACNFTFDDVDPKLVLMLLLRVGVVLPQELLDLYRDGP